jgi:hypothetical protein
VRSNSESSSIPGAALLGFWPAIAAIALAFNVFYLRKFHAGLISGKLSDFAASFLLPIFLVASAEWLLALLRVLGLRIEPRVGKLGILIACLIGAGYFTLLKTWPAFTDVHRMLLTWLDAPFGGKRSFRNHADPTDLVALICYPLAGWYLMRKSTREG